MTPYERLPNGHMFRVVHTREVFIKVIGGYITKQGRFCPPGFLIADKLECIDLGPWSEQCHDIII